MSLREVDVEFAHRFDDLVVDAVGGPGAAGDAGDDVHFVDESPALALGEGGRHLTPSGVLDADEAESRVFSHGTTSVGQSLDGSSENYIALRTADWAWSVRSRT